MKQFRGKPKMTDKSNQDPEKSIISSEDISAIVYNFSLPAILATLINEDLVDPLQENNKEYLWHLVKENVDLLNEINLIVEFHGRFRECAKEEFSKDHIEVGIVLIATSLEQVMNINLRLLLGTFHFSVDEITNIIKTSNIESKLSWIIKLITSIEIPNDIKDNIKAVFELRNSIVHYKATPCKLEEEDTLDKIRKRVVDLGIENIINLPEVLDKIMKKMIDEASPLYSRAEKLVEIMKN